MDKIVVEQEAEANIRILGRMIVKSAGRFVADPYLGTRADQAMFRVPLKEFDLLRDPARIGKIIMVLSRNITSSRERDTTVERRRKTLRPPDGRRGPCGSTMLSR